MPELQTPVPETSQHPAHVEASQTGVALQVLVSTSQTCPDAHATHAVPPAPHATASVPSRQREVPASQHPEQLEAVHGGGTVPQAKSNARNQESRMGARV